MGLAVLVRRNAPQLHISPLSVCGSAVDSLDGCHFRKLAFVRGCVGIGVRARATAIIYHHS
jgi:hypothetical protein